MGAGATTVGIVQAVCTAQNEDLEATLKELPASLLKKIANALESESESLSQAGAERLQTKDCLEIEESSEVADWQLQPKIGRECSVATLRAGEDWTGTPWNLRHLKQSFVERAHLIRTNHDSYAGKGIGEVIFQRDRLIDDCMRVFSPASMLPARLRVTFEGGERISSLDDIGGVSREFFPLAVEAFMRPERGLFRFSNVDNLTYQLVPFGSEGVPKEKLDELNVFGRLVAKALNQNCTTGVHFTRSLYRHLLSEKATLDDLALVETDVFRSLEWMLDNAVTEELGLTFTTPDFGNPSLEVELTPGGADIVVTDSNKFQFIRAKVRQITYDRISEQVDAFVTGFHSIVPQKYLRLLSAQELELLMAGSHSIDLEDWRKNCICDSADPQVIEWWWEIVEKSFTDDMRSKLLQFVTGTSRLPAGGFASLQMVNGKVAPFTIRVFARKYPGELPKSHTCFNEIILPKYETREEMENALSIVIEYGSQGFHEGD